MQIIHNITRLQTRETRERDTGHTGSEVGRKEETQKWGEPIIAHSDPGAELVFFAHVLYVCMYKLMPMSRALVPTFP
jgi:hypothetical protein